MRPLASGGIKMTSQTTSHSWRRFAWVFAIAAAGLVILAGATARAQDPQVQLAVSGGLDWLAATQSRLGNWSTPDGQYPTAMTALAGVALASEGSTTTQGKYSEYIRRTVDFLVSRSNPNGLIGDQSDGRYTYGHGFSMLFLSQVLGEEEDELRRTELIDVLTRAVDFTGKAQTAAGGWGYVSARDNSNFDEGSTTITQVQGLRGCRNAGIPVPSEIIEKAVKYIQNCTLESGGVQYSSRGGGARPAISAAAIACLFNAGEYDSEYVPRVMKFCEENLGNVGQDNTGHWHYAHYYYSQVRYREGGETWTGYREQIFARLLREKKTTELGGKTLVYWDQGNYGPVYTTAINLTILQLDKAMLPIYQR